MLTRPLLPLLVAAAAMAADPATVITTAAATTATNPISFTITFGAPVQGLTAPELVVAGGTVVGLAAVSPSGGYASQWLVNISPSSEGTVSIQVPANVATTASAEGNQLSNLVPVLYDTPPSPTYSVPSVTATQLTFRISFDETWNVANAGLITVSGAAIASQGQVGTGAAATYDLLVTPYGNGSIALRVGAGAFTDIDGVADASPAGGTSYDFGATPDGTEAAVVGTRFVSPTDHSYGNGQTVDLEVVFSRPVSVVGPTGSEPFLALAAQGTNPSVPVARYQSASGTALRFRYTVANGNYTPLLDYTGTDALTIGSQGGIIGDDGFIAHSSLPAPGAGGSLSRSGAVGVNYTPPKPPVADVAGPNTVDSCGTGSGIALLFAGSLLGLSTLRRRR